MIKAFVSVLSELANFLLAFIILNVVVPNVPALHALVLAAQ